MILFLAATFAATTTNTSPLMRAWADCMSHYALPRLEKVSTVSIVDGGLAACGAEAAAVNRAYIHDYGPRIGNDQFLIVRSKVREHMIGFVNLAKAQRGYR